MVPPHLLLFLLQKMDQEEYHHHRGKMMMMMMIPMVTTAATTAIVTRLPASEGTLHTKKDLFGGCVFPPLSIMDRIYLPHVKEKIRRKNKWASAVILARYLTNPHGLDGDDDLTFCGRTSISENVDIAESNVNVLCMYMYISIRKAATSMCC